MYVNFTDYQLMHEQVGKLMHKLPNYDLVMFTQLQAIQDIDETYPTSSCMWMYILNACCCTFVVSLS